MPPNKLESLRDTRYFQTLQVLAVTFFVCGLFQIHSMK